MSDRGMTLLEALVALGIAAMILAVGLPMLSTGPSALDIESAAREIAAGLREARAQAVATDRPVSFAVDVASGSFGNVTLRHLGRGSAGLRLELYTTEDLREGQASGVIRFFPDGASTGGGIAVGDGRRRFLVLVDWLSGNISVVRDAARS